MDGERRRWELVEQIRVERELVRRVSGGEKSSDGRRKEG